MNAGSNPARIILMKKKKPKKPIEEKRPIPDWYLKLPEEKISQKIFNSLPEYSISNPTGTMIGKVWKSDLNYFPIDHLWVIKEYMNHPTNPDLVKIDLRRPVIKD
jgi:hypothetical protein